MDSEYVPGTNIASIVSARTLHKFPARRFLLLMFALGCSSVLPSVTGSPHAQTVVPGTTEEARELANGITKSERRIEDLEEALRQEKQRPVTSDVELQLNQETILKLESDVAHARQSLDGQRARLRQIRQEADRPVDATGVIERSRRELGELEASSREAQLKLSESDRRKVQVALTSLLFDTQGADGVLGPRSREMIAAWQKARGLPATGFIDLDQKTRLFKEGEAAIRKLEADQRRRLQDRAPVVFEPSPPSAPSTASQGVQPPATPRQRTTEDNLKTLDLLLK